MSYDGAYNSHFFAVFLSLVRLGINRCSNSHIIVEDWGSIKDCAVKQGLSAVILDGIDKLSLGSRPPKPFLLNWIGEVMIAYDQRFDTYRRSISELAKWYNSNDFKMMVLKGFACSLNWPKPEHRPCGDIDIWMFGQQKKADALLSSDRGIKIDTSHHHHTVFQWEGFSVENHYDFINIYHNKQNNELEKLFKKLGKDDANYVEICGEKIYIPSPNLHALFLLHHMTTDFVSTVVTLRQLLDWAFFINNNHKRIDWRWLMIVLEQFGMKKIFMIFNAICVEDLGFETAIFPTVQYNPVLKDKVLKEIVAPLFSAQMPSNIVKRVIYKYRRWRASEWKRKLCFNENMIDSFISGVRSHLIKPSTI